MRKAKRYLALLMAGVLAVTSVNLPAVSAYAQDAADSVAEVAEATPGDADEIVDIEEGIVTKVDITTGGQKIKLRFTPKEDEKYVVYSTSDMDTKAILYNSEGAELTEDDDSGEDSNFKFTYDMKAGETYIISAYLYSSDATGSFDVCVEKKAMPMSMEITEECTQFLEKINYSGFVDFKASITYENGDEFSMQVGDESFTVDGIQFSVWIKDKDGKYTHPDEYGYEDSYIRSGILDKGTYTVVITDYEDFKDEGPSSDVKVWGTYDINVQTADDYFEGRDTISDIEKKNFKTRDYVYEFYKFSPSDTGKYLFAGTDSPIDMTVYDSSLNPVAAVSVEPSRYYMEKGKEYYVGVEGWRYDADENKYNDTDIIAQLYSKPVKADITMTRTEFMSGMYNDIASNMQVTIHRDNGQTEKLEPLEYYWFKDKNGQQYELYYAANGQEWNAERFSGELPDIHGTYTMSLGYYESGEYVQLGSTQITIGDMDELTLPVLKIGENKLHSAKDWSMYDDNVYKFTAEYDGELKLDSDTWYKIYQIKDGTKTELSSSNILQAGMVYYVKINYGWYDNEEDRYIYDATVNVTQTPCIRYLKVSKAPDTLDFIRGMKGNLRKDVEIEVDYSNGESEKLKSDEGRFVTKYRERLDMSFIHNGQTIDLGSDIYYDEDGIDTSMLPLGKVEVVVASPNGVKCSYELNIHKVTDYVVDTLKLGKNEIDTKGNKNVFYEFTPETTAIYDLGAGIVKFIGHEITYNGEEKLTCDAESKSQMLLEKGVTYYLDLSDGVQDKWGDTVYSWTMDIQIAEDGEYATPVKWSFDPDNENKKLVYTDMNNRGSVKNDIDGTAMNISYDNGTTRTCILQFDYDSDPQVDRFKNKLEFSLLKYNEETSEYEEYTDYMLQKGQYKAVYKLVDRNGTVYTKLESLETPFEVYNVTDSPDGEWDITKPLYINNNQNRYLYKVNVPENARSVTFTSNTSLDELNIFDGEGSRLDSEWNTDDMYEYSRSIDVNGNDIYIEIIPSSKVDISKLTVFTNEEVVAVNTTIKRTDYICGVDSIAESDIVTTIVYRDGTHKEVEGRGNGIDIKLLDENGEYAGYFANRLTKSGKYKVVANVIGMSDTCKVNGADITVSPFDVSAATKVKLGEEVTESNTSDVDSIKVYSFTPDEDMDVAFDSSARDVGVYTMTDGNIDYYGGIGISYPVDAGVTYYIVVKVKCGSTNVTSVNKYDPGKAIRETIIAGTDKELTMSNNDVAYLTFVPEVSGVYTIYIDGDKKIDPYVELFRDGDHVVSSDDCKDDKKFSLTADFDKDVEYEFVINVRRAGTFNVSLKHVENDKEISSVRFLDDTFEATRSGSEDYVSVSGDIEIIYDDNTRGTVSYTYGTNYDKYNNVIQGQDDEEIVDGKEQSVVEIRYRNKNSSTWSDVYKLRIDVKEDDPAIVKELAEGETFDSSLSSDKVSKFIFAPEKTGKYVINITTDSGDEERITVTGDAGEEIYAYKSAYSMKKGIQYSIKIDTSGDYKITVVKVSAIADVEIVSCKGKLYSGITGCYGDDTLEVKVTYADGTTETVAGGGRLSDGRTVYYDYNCNSSAAAIIHVEVGGVYTYKKVAYSDKNDIKSLVFKNGISTTKIPKLGGSEKVTANLYKVIIPANGKYAIEYGSDREVLMSGLGTNWYNADDILDDNLKAGDVYYLCIPSDAGVFCFAPESVLDWQVVKAATCTNAGSKKKYVPSLGKYITETIPATGHSYTHYVSDNNATCQKAGTKTAKCDNGCGSKKVIEDTDKPALGHLYSDKWSLVKAAGYNVDGYKAHICTRCGGASTARRIVNKIAAVTLAQTSYVYDGKVHNPGVIVVDSKGKLMPVSKYKVTYSSKKEVGKVAVKVTFKGDYKGSVKREFTIKPAATSITGIQNVANGIKVSWKKSSSAGGYIVQRRTGSGKFVKVKTITSANVLSYIDTTAKRQGTAYSYRVVAYRAVSGVKYGASASAAKTYYFVSGTKVAKAVNSRAGKVTVSWNKNKSATGYQIQYATNTKFSGAKTVIVRSGSKTSAVIANLKKKKYYIRMRGYRSVKGTNYFSVWSSAKNITVSK